MAKIIYKEGCEGQNKIECIEGIEIDMLNGQCALIYPKYADLPLLDFEQIDDWKAKSMTQIKALNVEENIEETDELLTLNSPAAEFVRKFKSDIHGHFNIPTLLAGLDIVRQLREINKLAKTIEGAELLRKGVTILSCSRCSQEFGWVTYSRLGVANVGILDGNHTCVPTIIYKKPQTVYMVVSERVEEVETNTFVDEIRIFSKLDEAKTFAKRKLEDVLKIFDVTKDDVRVEETEEDHQEEVYYIHVDFFHHYTKWDIWVSIHKKEIE